MDGVEARELTEDDVFFVERCTVDRHAGNGAMQECDNHVLISET